MKERKKYMENDTNFLKEIDEIPKRYRPIAN